MKILILGGGGMIGQKLITYLAKNPVLNGKNINEVRLVDAFIEPKVPSGAPFPIHSQIADITNRESCDALVKEQPEIIFHLAAIVSGEA